MRRALDLLSCISCVSSIPIALRVSLMRIEEHVTQLCLREIATLIIQMCAGLSSWTVVQSGTWLDVRFGSKADICNANRHVRFTQGKRIKCDIWMSVKARSGHGPTLFNHLVGATDQGVGDRDAQR